jgi:AcrR family transcriptional regulator
MELSKKECILSAAAKIFGRFGFRKTSVNEIAESAGVAKGTVYLACDSKEDLFFQVLHRDVREWVAAASLRIDPRARADTSFEPVLAASLELLDKHPLVGELLSGKVDATMPGWESRLSELRALARSHLEELLRLGVRQGVLRERTEPAEVARVVQDLMVAAVRTPGEPASSQSARQRLATGIELILAGLRVPAA